MTVSGRDALDQFAQTMPSATLRLHKEAIILQLQATVTLETTDSTGT